MLNFLSPSASKFKFRNLKTYSSTEWFVDNSKNYRNVFDRYEVDYIYGEFSFYNKQFDVKNWTLKFNLKCFFQEKDGSSSLICDLSFDKEIEQEDPVVYIREGWGNVEKGAFWKEGTYCWEAFVDHKKIETDFFHIYETGNKYASPSSYIDVKSIKLYECGGNDDLAEATNPYKVFSSETTRYVGFRVQLNNLLPKKRWFCEVKMRIYHQSRSLKAEVKVICPVKREDPTIEASFYWGSDEFGSWTKGAYIVEFSFLEELIAVVPLEVTTSVEEGIVEAYINPQYQAELRTEKTSETLTDFILKTNQSILIQKLANSEIALVIKELLSHADKKGLDGLTKKVVNLSAKFNRLSTNERSEMEDKAYKEINEALIDLVYSLDLINLSEI
jgi:hypothetical protein